MIIEQFIKDKDRLTKLKEVVDELQHINAIAMFLEIAANRSAPSPSTEGNALAGAWHQGYIECLRDIVHFEERFLSQLKPAPTADFGAASNLLNAGDISYAEYEKIKNG